MDGRINHLPRCGGRARWYLHSDRAQNIPVGSPRGLSMLSSCFPATCPSSGSRYSWRVSPAPLDPRLSQTLRLSATTMATTQHGPIQALTTELGRALPAASGSHQNPGDSYGWEDIW